MACFAAFLPWALRAVYAESSCNLDFLLTQGPSITAYRICINQVVRSSTDQPLKTRQFVQSLINVTCKLSTSSRRNLPCDNPDITVMKVWPADSQTVLLSDHIPSVLLYMPDEAPMEAALSAIQDTIQETL